MRTTIDGAGRLVIPKEIRQQAGLRAGTELDIRLRNGVIEIEPTPIPVELVRKGHLLVAVPLVKVEPITADDVERVREEIERERGLR
jgi:AbrB family looped-hinge helix DNA binding protein